MNILCNLGFKRKESKKETQKTPTKDMYDFKFTNRYSREEGEKRIYNLIILDESGSMSTVRMQAFNGANDTIQTIRAAQQENNDDNQMLSLVTFDHNEERDDVRILIDCQKIEEVKVLELEQYKPCGMTPLYDAIGLSITALEELVKDGDNVLVTVITDGWENCSKIFTSEMIKQLVETLNDKGWTFTYIGANQNSEQTSSCLGFESSMDFQVSDSGTDIMFGRLMSGMNCFLRKVRRSREMGKIFKSDGDFFSEKEALSRVTPDYISNLKANEIFVFGSDEGGHHLGGASAVALRYYGAIMGQGSGLQGNSYAIPTMNIPIDKIAKYVKEFIIFAERNSDLTFMVTRIGCGSAGYIDEQIAPLFARAYSLPNVYLPASFWKVLTYKYNERY